MADKATGEQREGYAPGYGDRPHAHMVRRRADEAAGFFIPYLRAGMRVLDVGAGPGAITLDLAELVAPGEVVGLDIELRQVERARALAAERGVTTARFDVGDAYALPFPDGSFDAVFAHAVLMWLRDPTAALREFRRVLRPGGLAGLRDMVLLPFFEPATPLLQAFMVLHRQVVEHTLGRPTQQLDFQHRRLLLEAGFARTEATAEFRSHGTPETVHQLGSFLAGQLDEVFRPAIMGMGWADAARIDALVQELHAWAERPDAFGATG